MYRPPSGHRRTASNLSDCAKTERRAEQIDAVHAFLIGRRRGCRSGAEPVRFSVSIESRASSFPSERRPVRVRTASPWSAHHVSWVRMSTSRSPANGAWSFRLAEWQRREREHRVVERASSAKPSTATAATMASRFSKWLYRTGWLYSMLSLVAAR